jgi:hypothetical protein
VILILIGGLAFSLTSLVLGVRLCLLARRTRQLPEALIGVGFVSGGFIGSTLQWVIPALKPSEPWLSLLTLLLRFFAALSCALLTLVAWRVFRPTERWARILVSVLMVCLAEYVIRFKPIGRLAPSELKNPVHWIETLSLAAPYVWLTLESLRYQGLIRRRWSVGLPADLVVAARMRLWAIGLGAIGVMLPSLDVVRVINYVAGLAINPALMISSMGLVCAICLWLAFFLPPSYQRQIELQAATPPV